MILKVDQIMNQKLNFGLMTNNIFDHHTVNNFNHYEH